MRIESGAALLHTQPKDDPKKIVDAAKNFEALLISQMLQTMQAGSEGWLGTTEDKTMESAMGLANEQFGKALSASGGLGLAKLIESGLAKPTAVSVSPAQPKI
jgi:Rod binding domain-containing protein